MYTYSHSKNLTTQKHTDTQTHIMIKIVMLWKLCNCQQLRKMIVLWGLFLLRSLNNERVNECSVALLLAHRIPMIKGAMKAIELQPHLEWIQKLIPKIRNPNAKLNTPNNSPFQTDMPSPRFVSHTQ